MLPQDVMFDILTRLPAKSIGRFRCVSKSWRSLLFQIHFIKAHFHRNKQYPVEKTLILVSTSSSCLYSSSLINAHHLFDEITLTATKLNIAIQPDSSYESICSCKGLILVKDVEDKNFLVNPTTRIMRELSVSPSVSDLSTTTYGLGYDLVSDDYKVVTLTRHHSDPERDELFVYVYSVKNGTWKKAGSYKQADCVLILAHSGVCVSGRVHWLARRVADYSHVVLGFDLAEEKFWELPLPSGIPQFDFYRIVELDERLCMFNGTVAWVMKEYGVADSWTKFTIVGDEGVEFRLVCSVGPGELMLVQDEDTFDEKLVVYNLKEHTFKNVVIHGMPPKMFHIGGTFIESIVSPYYYSDVTGGE